MKTRANHPVQYELPFYDNLEFKENLPMNNLIGKSIQIIFSGQINCVVTGESIKKTFGEGMSYKAFKTSPLAVESIIRPELSRAHLGEGLRDIEWEKEHDLQPHFVYLALTDAVKVGVTRQSNLPARWMDQGAWKTIILAETPYRQLAGEIEVWLKAHLTDKTNWRKMLTDVRMDIDLAQKKEEIISLLPDDFQKFISPDNTISEFFYPVLEYPEKVTSLKLDKIPVIEKKLMGIRGQYLIFEDNKVINIRSHSGYRIKISV